MKIHFTNRLRTKAFSLVVILLLATAVSLTVLITHNPQVLLTGRFTTLPPGATLPSETDCASRVYRSSWEPRPDNFAANHRVPTVAQIATIAPWTTSSQGIQLDSRSDIIRKQITGNFTGTTYEILQWVACKWGINEDIVKAEAVVESNWNQNGLGDKTTNQSFCPPESGYPGKWDGSSCYQSYGILQIKYFYFKSTWPMSKDDTAFNIDYTYGWIRNCYEGWTTYLLDRTPVSGYQRYHAGDLWGCIGMWYSGGWYDKNAIRYINEVKTNLVTKPWLQLGF